MLMSAVTTLARERYTNVCQKRMQLINFLALLSEIMNTRRIDLQGDGYFRTAINVFFYLNVVKKPELCTYTLTARAIQGKRLWSTTYSRVCTHQLPPLVEKGEKAEIRRNLTFSQNVRHARIEYGEDELEVTGCLRSINTECKKMDILI